jgi:hypothetical protein
MLVGFADKLRLMNVLMDDVKVIKEVGWRTNAAACWATSLGYLQSLQGPSCWHRCEGVRWWMLQRSPQFENLTSGPHCSSQ